MWPFTQLQSRRVRALSPGDLSRMKERPVIDAREYDALIERINEELKKVRPFDDGSRIVAVEINDSLMYRAVMEAYSRAGWSVTMRSSSNLGPHLQFEIIEPVED